MSWRDRQKGEDDYDINGFKRNEPKDDRILQPIDDYEFRRALQDYNEGFRHAEHRAEERQEEERAERQRQDRVAFENQQARYNEEQEYNRQMEEQQPPEMEEEA